ncbi:MAG: hypothetical protein QNJ09_15580 [Paracoccaceae bacterium]|nr:hypothetical protein [Paracoccaceae bacterium]
MKQFAPFLIALSLSTTPALAQEQEEGLSLMERGAQLFFRGLMDEMEPVLDGLEGMAREMEPALRDFAQQMGPALRDLMDEVEDWSAYHPPEVLPNGDIILRKKTPQEMAEPQGEIEL